MARRVFVHLGLPKTGTTYLQTILWSSRDRLRSDGLLLPGDERRDHLWTSRVVREDPNLAKAPKQHTTAWKRLRKEIKRFSGDALVSHEFFAAASAEQAATMVGELESAGAEVHLVVTAREPLGLFTASWQEALKNKRTEPMAEYGRAVSANPNAIWNWRTLDLRLVLERWAPAVAPDRVHVVVMDTIADRTALWRDFCDVVGLPADAYDTELSFPNESMGVVEAETLRRINLALGNDFNRAFAKGVYLRTFLADERLVPRGGERFWPEPDQIQDCRRRGRATVDHLATAGYDIHGDVDRLLVPEELPERRTPSSVTDAEVAQCAVELVATLLGDVRDLRSGEK